MSYEALELAFKLAGAIASAFAFVAIGVTFMIMAYETLR